MSWIIPRRIVSRLHSVAGGFVLAHLVLTAARNLEAESNS
jgi:hypothetical protein